MTDTTNTPTPEMDAFERDIIACIPEELHQLQAYARKGRELEARLAAAEAELAAMRSGEVVAWEHHTGRVISDTARRSGIGTLVEGGKVYDGAGFSIPLYRSSAPDAVVEALVALVSDSIEEVECWACYCPEFFKMKHKYDERVNDLRARLAALTGQAKKGEG